MMAKTKVAVSLDAKLVDRLNTLVRQSRFPNRSHAIETALEEKLDRLEHTRLARECAKLNPREEAALADEGLREDLAAWPEY
jgi:metal-responsive CopG/Arc/MetJ family transcriptional regulator